MKRCYTPKRFTAPHSTVIRQANAILESYAEQGYEMTLRQLYYQFVARDLIPNRDSEYNRLGGIVTAGRMAGLIDWDHLVDRTRNLQDWRTDQSPAQVVRDAARRYSLARWDNQPTRVEVWVEKEALVGVVERACGQVAVPFFACRGYVSKSEMQAAGRRLGRHLRNRQRVVVLHLGDHDPSGIDMTRDNRDQLRNFVFQDWLHDDPYDQFAADESYYLRDIEAKMGEALGFDLADGPIFEVRRIALNWDQIEEYQPPPNPAKVTDSRFEGYREQYGEESWELDALPPNVLAGLIQGEVEDLRDEDLWGDVVERELTERSLLQRASDHWPEVVQFLAELEEAGA